MFIMQRIQCEMYKQNRIKKINKKNFGIIPFNLVNKHINIWNIFFYMDNEQQIKKEYDNISNKLLSENPVCKLSGEEFSPIFTNRRENFEAASNRLF